MGIKGLFTLISKHAPGAVKTVSVAELQGECLVVDAPIMIAQWSSAGMKFDIRGSLGTRINHIIGAFYRTSDLILNGISVVYVFEGRAPVAKQATIQRRRETRARRGEENDGGKSNVKAETGEILSLLGCPIINADSEAEEFAAAMTHAGYYAVVSEDLDCLAFGAARMIRGLKSRSGAVTVIDGEAVLRELGLTRAQFVDLCIMLGCDYTGTIPGVGSARALKLIREHGSIEAILRHLGVEPAGFDYESARAEFLRNRRVPAHLRGLAMAPLGEDRLQAVRRYLVDTHGGMAARIDPTLLRLREHFAAVH